mmetsp:Transcript_15975/g.34263  ORF Transcript_15975/g.34263 Transcript_15975/m.34263 type:complete len:258 (+) Transcript_15975:783-1556(+)
MRAPGVSSTSSEPRDAPAALRDGGGRHRAGRDWAGRDEVGLPLEPAQGLSLRHGGGARGRRREEEVLDAVALVRKVRVRHERRLRQPLVWSGVHAVLPDVLPLDIVKLRVQSRRLPLERDDHSKALVAKLSLEFLVLRVGGGLGGVSGVAGLDHVAHKVVLVGREQRGGGGQVGRVGRVGAVVDGAVARVLRACRPRRRHGRCAAHSGAHGHARCDAGHVPVAVVRGAGVGVVARVMHVVGNLGRDHREVGGGEGVA